MLTVVADSGELKVAKAQIGAFKTNVYYIFDKPSRTVVVIDAPKPSQKVISFTDRHTPILLLITHAHWDHMDGAAEVARAVREVGIGESDLPRDWDTPILDVSTGKTYENGYIRLECFHTPGHTPGSTSYLLRSKKPLGNDFFFVGDTLFPGGPGVTANPDAFEQAERSIAAKILAAPDDCLVMPGHGPPITVGEARREYEVFKQRRESAPATTPLYGHVRWKD